MKTSHVIATGLLAIAYAISSLRGIHGSSTDRPIIIPSQTEALLVSLASVFFASPLILVPILGLNVPTIVAADSWTTFEETECISHITQTASTKPDPTLPPKKSSEVPPGNPYSSKAKYLNMCKRIKGAINTNGVTTPLEKMYCDNYCHFHVAGAPVDCVGLGLIDTSAFVDAFTNFFAIDVAGIVELSKDKDVFVKVLDPEYAFDKNLAAASRYEEPIDRLILAYQSSMQYAILAFAVILVYYLDDRKHAMLRLGLLPAYIAAQLAFRTGTTHVPFIICSALFIFVNAWLRQGPQQMQTYSALVVIMAVSFVLVLSFPTQVYVQVLYMAAMIGVLWYVGSRILESKAAGDVYAMAFLIMTLCFLYDAGVAIITADRNNLVVVFSLKVPSTVFPYGSTQWFARNYSMNVEGLAAAFLHVFPGISPAAVILGFYFAAAFAFIMIRVLLEWTRRIRKTEFVPDDVVTFGWSYLTDFFVVLRFVSSIFHGHYRDSRRRRVFVVDGILTALVFTEWLFARELFVIRLIASSTFGNASGVPLVGLEFEDGTSVDEQTALTIVDCEVSNESDQLKQQQSAYPQNGAPAWYDSEHLARLSAAVTNVIVKGSDGRASQGTGILRARDDSIIELLTVDHVLGRAGVSFSLQADQHHTSADGVSYSKSGMDPVRGFNVTPGKHSAVPASFSVLSAAEADNVKQLIVLAPNKVNCHVADTGFTVDPGHMTGTITANLKAGDSGSPVIAVLKTGALRYAGAVSTGQKPDKGNVFSLAFGDNVMAPANGNSKANKGPRTQEPRTAKKRNVKRLAEAEEVLKENEAEHEHLSARTGPYFSINDDAARLKLHKENMADAWLRLTKAIAGLPLNERQAFIEAFNLARGSADGA